MKTLGALGVGIYYSLKANSNQAVIRTLGQLGAGADVVSVGEMHRALKAGMPADKIVFAGVGKTAMEMEAALEAGIHQFNVESLRRAGDAERRRGQRMGVKAPVTLRINPDVDAKTHAKISTGKAENKFGIDIEQAAQFYSAAARMKGIRIVGLAVHIGSQLTDIAPYRAAFAEDRRAGADPAQGRPHGRAHRSRRRHRHRLSRREPTIDLERLRGPGAARSSARSAPRSRSSRGAASSAMPACWCRA